MITPLVALLLSISPKGPLEQAAKDYYARDFGAAERGYASALAAGDESADLEYDLGTAAAQAGDVGQAVLHLERALALAPWDNDVRANLERIRERRLDKVVGQEIGDGPMQRLLRGIPIAPLGWTAALLWLLACGLVALRRRRNWALGLAIPSGILALLALGLTLGCRRVQSEPFAVVVAPVGAVRPGPDPALHASFEVHEGLKVLLEGREGGYARIRLANGLEGYIDAAAVERI
ncbi:MAG: hypothetical protein ACYCWW_11180 [Deltaproteobacteria bacterium]